MTHFRFVTIDDPKAQLDGFLGWEFGGNASFLGFCEYAWRYHNHFDEEFENQDDQSDALMYDYLVSVGENPADYDLERPDPIMKLTNARIEDVSNKNDYMIIADLHINNHTYEISEYLDIDSDGDFELYNGSNDQYGSHGNLENCDGYDEWCEKDSEITNLLEQELAKILREN